MLLLPISYILQCLDSLIYFSCTVPCECDSGNIMGSKYPLQDSCVPLVKFLFLVIMDSFEILFVLTFAFSKSSAR